MVGISLQYTGEVYTRGPTAAVAFLTADDGGGGRGQRFVKVVRGCGRLREVERWDETTSTSNCCLPVKYRLYNRYHCNEMIWLFVDICIRKLVISDGHGELGPSRVLSCSCLEPKENETRPIFRFEFCHS